MENHCFITCTHNSSSTFFRKLSLTAPVGNCCPCSEILFIAHCSTLGCFLFLFCFLFLIFSTGVLSSPQVEWEIREGRGPVVCFFVTPKHSAQWGSSKSWPISFFLGSFLLPYYRSSSNLQKVSLLKGYARGNFCKSRISAFSLFIWILCSFTSNFKFSVVLGGREWPTLALAQDFVLFHESWYVCKERTFCIPQTVARLQANSLLHILF